MDEDYDENAEDYCYNCGYYHRGPVSYSGPPAEGCADYEYPPTQGEPL